MHSCPQPSTDSGSVVINVLRRSVVSCRGGLRDRLYNSIEGNSGMCPRIARYMSCKSGSRRCHWHRIAAISSGMRCNSSWIARVMQEPVVLSGTLISPLLLRVDSASISIYSWWHSLRVSLREPCISPGVCVHNAFSLAVIVVRTD